ncbi:hypothetical protein HanHA300_Chr13g0504981 [Helianthus annuus]|nr:hypothetical protein HanHA300_Chr13g0504981 [Helianthus annuus]KAJ0499702.1 hypothetical protein HanHA89_Chr13g0536881 [Helianthus annuus]
MFFFGVEDIIKFHKHVRGSGKWRKVLHMVLKTTLWCIWGSRNKAIFKGLQQRVENIEEEIKVLGNLWCKNGCWTHLE